jgi:hypothetical protein
MVKSAPALATMKKVSQHVTADLRPLVAADLLHLVGDRLRPVGDPLHRVEGPDPRRPCASDATPGRRPRRRVVATSS